MVGEFDFFFVAKNQNNKIEYTFPIAWSDIDIGY